MDFYDYSISIDRNNIILKNLDQTFEKSIRLGYIKQEMQEALFFGKRYNVEDDLFLDKLCKLVVDEHGDKLYKCIDNGILTRYRFEIPTELLEKVAEQSVEGKIQLFKEEFELEYFSKEMCMNLNELYNKRLTQKCNAYDILLCQRFFRIMYFIQRNVYQKEKEIRVILQSLIPSMKKDGLKEMLYILLKDRQKVDEVFDLLTYNINFKYDIQYTPFLGIGDKVIFPTAVLARSNLVRNTIAYSYLSQNKIVNDDGGVEPLVKVCENCFKSCSYKYEVFTNKKEKMEK